MHFKYIYLHKLFAATNNPHAWVVLKCICYTMRKKKIEFSCNIETFSNVFMQFHISVPNCSYVRLCIKGFCT